MAAEGSCTQRQVKTGDEIPYKDVAICRPLDGLQALVAEPRAVHKRINANANTSNQHNCDLMIAIPGQTMISKHYNGQGDQEFLSLKIIME